ncbi:MAG: DUF3987 domain-containing protein, partial [Candidatus Solibacter sp.]|nr:DUF3987 domain-containing protein [Candidatus Solibacter sp.]
VQWPEPLGPQAYHGLAGDVIRAIEPNTESDVAALLVQFLLAFGNVIGRHAHWKVEATNHYLNLFAVLVGQTSKARKGTSLDRVLDLFAEIDGEWLRDRRMSGLSTGEGLISEVKDPILKRNKDGEMVEVEAGVADKRLLVTEPEFARVLKVGEREAATLPSIQRDAWDRGELRTMTKNSPLQATGAHISMIAHITEGELKRTLSDTNRSNGFANRFLWVCVRRSKALPLGGDSLPPEDREKLVRRIRDAAKHAEKVHRMALGSRAMPLWKKLYPQLSEGLPGMLGAATDRSEAQVRRLACLYALLDGERFVREEHLRAALEVWRYCLDSARFLFGASLGDPVAETILKELRRRGSGGITRNEIRKELFGQNKSSEAIGHALQSLQSGGRARCQKDPCEGVGRPTERWYAV